MTAASGRPLAGARVMVRALADTGIAVEAISDAEGRFRIKGLPVGRYALRITCFGYVAADRDAAVNAADPLVDLGAVRLMALAVPVKGVEVTAARPAMRTAGERTIYAAASLPASAGGTAMDLLRQIPELEVEPAGGVRLRGSSSVAIHFDGRPATLHGEALEGYLRQLPADRIERVEIVPNPPAKYGAEGVAGIVDIVLKDRPDGGGSGTVTAYGGTSGEGAYLALARRNGPLSLFGNMSLGGSRNSSSNQDLRQNLLARPLTLLEQDGSMSNSGRTAVVQVNATLQATARTRAQASLTGNAWSYDGSGRVLYELKDSSLLLLDQLHQLGEGGSTNRSGEVALGGTYSFEPRRHELTVELRASDGDEDIAAHYLQQLLNGDGSPLAAGEEMSVNTTRGTDRQVSLQVDYVHPLGKPGRLETGVRVLERRAASDEALTVFAPAAALEPKTRVPGGYLYHERINSAYLSLRRQLGAAELQAGMRVEGATSRFRVGSTGRSYDTDQVSAFPGASLSLPLGSGPRLRLAYSRRVQRPFAQLLDPDVPVTDSLNRMQGNPSLLPEYTQNASADLDWTGRRGVLRLSPYYRRIVDSWDQVKRVDSLGAAVLTWENVASLTTYGAAATGALPGEARLTGSASLGAYRELREAGNLSADFSGSALRLTASANASFKATPYLRLDASGSYSPPRDLPQGRISSTVLTTMAARRTFGEHARVNLMVSDPFALWHYSFETHDQTHIQTSRNSFSMRNVMLYASYSFGSSSGDTRALRAAEPQPPRGNAHIH